MRKKTMAYGGAAALALALAALLAWAFAPRPVQVGRSDTAIRKGISPCPCVIVPLRCGP